MFKQLMDRFNQEFVGKQKNDWHPIGESVYYGVMTDEDLAGMQARNEAAIKKCITEMGDKWVLHKSHEVKRHVSE